MSVAIVQGCSKGLGRALVQKLLSTTKLNVVGTTASGAKHAREAILCGTSDTERRLVTLDMDIRDETAVRRAREQVQERFGDKPLRMLINVSGMLHAEKNIMQISHAEAMRTFEINVIGHLLAFKHFVPLVARMRNDGEDLSEGLLPGGKSVLASISARVGSIGDNELGGWYSYRASKAAVNQVIKTLSLELKLRNVAAVALAYHPGTVRTGLSAEFVGPEFKAPGSKDREYGIFDADEAATRMLEVMRGMDGKSGSFLDWRGSDVPW